ncbi:hypothetical protein I6F35_19800 [Bradyrhizobium sp. BRP22]|uniref:hypothetical protein n=1 Tax=Bradyrhizobium sp. BRP22 TaxID=2793821 RepID=UPI001CD2A0D0|nr:hypothetical protein [Bradyrhizobium sp. BRP22]MCA1455433.1 hypothetical protein [Bradyrhizobium sp. BRP22]
MAEVSNELLFEILKVLQRDLSETKSSINEVKTELNAIRGHMISLQQDIHNVYGILGRYDVRLGRIESRLELHEAPTL